jgi:predicted RNA-binding Zn ribbon-like protein
MGARQSSDPPRSLSVDDTLPFRFVAGESSLDLVNTVDWTARGPERDRIGSYGRLIEWALAAKLIDDDEASRLERRAFGREREAARALELAYSLRWTLRRLVAALAAETPVPASVRLPLEELNRFVADAFAHVRLTVTPTGESDQPLPAWAWDDEPQRLDSLLWPVVRRAAELLASSDVRRLRVCPGTDCGWVYVDRSRNGMRRWCEMSTCGTAEKSRRRSERSP